MNTIQPVAILGGARIPFARQNSQYTNATNIDMLTAALRGVVQRFGLEGQRIGEVAAGAVLKHSRDTNLSREAALDSGLAPSTPAYDVQQACATSLETALLVGNKIALGQIDIGIAGGVNSSSDRAKLNVNGGSVGLGHPFAATGARILASAAKQLALHRKETGRSGRTLVSMCAAGGIGVVAILRG